MFKVGDIVRPTVPLYPLARDGEYVIADIFSNGIILEDHCGTFDAKNFELVEPEDDPIDPLKIIADAMRARCKHMSGSDSVLVHDIRAIADIIDPPKTPEPRVQTWFVARWYPNYKYSVARLVDATCAENAQQGVDTKYVTVCRIATPEDIAMCGGQQ